MEIRWTTKSEFIDIDTGEVLPYYNEKQLKYTDYIIINKTKKTKVHEKNGTITRTNFCKHTGQRKINFW